MKLIDLYNRVIETTGLDVMTIESVQAAVANCMADLTSRGYKCFKEIELKDLLKEDKLLIDKAKTMKEEPDINLINVLYQDDVSLKFRMPKDLRKTLYCKLYFPTKSCKATRYSVSNPRIDCKVIDGQFRTEIDPKSAAIFYSKNDIVIIEWRKELQHLINFQYGYYQKLTAPRIATQYKNLQELADIEIDIRPEFEDALVLYAVYFYYSRYLKDTDKITLYQNQYKYYIEDIIHELSYEDDFFEEDAVITTDED